jgi:hypothetical protein
MEATVNRTHTFWRFCSWSLLVLVGCSGADTEGKDDDLSGNGECILDEEQRSCSPAPGSNAHCAWVVAYRYDEALQCVEDRPVVAICEETDSAFLPAAAVGCYLRGTPDGGREVLRTPAQYGGYPQADVLGGECSQSLLEEVVQASGC